MEPGRNTGEARTPTLAERARKTVTRTRGFVHDSRQNVASGARTVGHNIRMAVGRAAERMVDNLHVLFPGLIRHPVGSYLKRAYGEFTVLELRDGVPYRNITAQSESRKIVTSFLRSLRLSYRFIPDVQGEPWYLDVADNINRLVAEAGQIPYPGGDRFQPTLDLWLSRIPFLVNIVQREAGRKIIDSLGFPDAEPLLTMVLPEANQTIQADVTVGDTRYRLQCQVDYVLWYGFKADADMLLIIITPKAMDEVRFAAPLAAMSLVYHLRKAAGRNAEIYGLYTDARDFYFYHIDNRGRYSTQPYVGGDRRLFYACRMLVKIFGQGYALARAMKLTPGFARMTELQVERTDDTVYDPIHQIMVDLRMPHPHPDVAG
ncbi:hypothetical protein BDV32DRAFT_147097 [Aspergillus pseudonomiae]|uniref:Uncharacterized protein n=1 Tax=Aspergillus pseudonomiae TaxID=1506151 RepID=A0A5N6I8B9_9EURO|nr:uncharacterized protein BDV37DRAFT_281146 [Aspergillus pseudonomiae]KAB8262922.1 hypothetical protein BDV32DRAFT_147097 [Aspergillus pseudonomiae]KAE8406236.1 hypothetical protein BDV37DRAFT_281146 [Aspergillus pseudonomiae]